MKLNQDGVQGNYPPVDPTGPGISPGKFNFEAEEALDVEWSHAIAPQANIILIETNDNFAQNLLTAGVSLARSIPQVSVVSMSLLFNEFSGELQFDSLFTTPAGHRGITFLASSGDTGVPGQYPAFSPNVVSVGGTSLMTDAIGTYVSETGWSGSGGGVSKFEAQPAFQKGVVTQSTVMRTSPDVAFDGNPDTGVAVYDSYDDVDNTGPWFQIGGTSLSCPCWAGIIAITDQDRARFGLDTLDGATQTLPRIYALPAGDFHDITVGNNGAPALPGYDLVTGRGTPIAETLIPDLAAVSSLTANNLKAFHPFRYVVETSAADPQSATTDVGNVTAINYGPAFPSGQFLLLLGTLPAGVTLDNSVPTLVTNTGQVAIVLPVQGLPDSVAVRVSILLHNPKHVPLSTFFEGFELVLAPAT
jgi:subtilase family serine protease